MQQVRDVVVEAREVRVGDAVVGVYEYGEPGGRPVLALHGVPACGAGFGWAHDAALARGMRIIAPDRPGVGRSTPRAVPETVADHPARLDALADALRLDGYAVLGYSGGGPYAAASAMDRSGRVTSVAIAGGMGQVGAWAAIDQFEKTDAQLLRLAARRPRLARAILGVSVRMARLAPGIAMRSFVGQLAPADRAVLAGLGAPRDAMRLFTESCTHGARGVVDDYATVGRTWGVALGVPLMPVTLWHGDADTMVPLAHSEALAAALGGVPLTVWPSEGHLGPITHIGEILDALT